MPAVRGAHRTPHPGDPQLTLARRFPPFEASGEQRELPLELTLKLARWRARDRCSLATPEIPSCRPSSDRRLGHRGRKRSPKTNVRAERKRSLEGNRMKRILASAVLLSSLAV